MEELLRAGPVVIILVGTAALGIGHTVKPDWFIARSGLRRGGELLTSWNRLQVRVLGLVIVGFSLFVFYDIFIRTR
jgi:hypothetical protein